ncbi:ethanolamine permease [Ferrimonas lipolytica]|uniref:Ethanolamine permease n=1 Tax=Ferrimonas lipolytica TaxID=2724191 RepID=A0A6H1U9H6_9GAMM|nr:ethanolamine permease [Ferrimonas lipolytica]QIZ75691.1 ethanolamine permease [Ferrimonas lipolytica]
MVDQVGSSGLASKSEKPQRQLKKGVAGWFLLATLGVSYVISGDYAGWNFGIAEAGWGGMLVAAIAMGVMYLTLVLTLAELSAAIPTAGAGYSFARYAIGPTAGFATGLAVLIEYALAPAAIVIFIGAYVDALIGWNGPTVYATFYLVFIGVHLVGAGEALKLMLVITAFAVLAIIVTAIGLVPHFDAANLFDIAANPEVAGSSTFLPEGWKGVWVALPFAIWLFLAVEGVPMAAEEAKDPAKDVPRGIIGAMIFLLCSAALVMLLVPGATGAKAAGSYAAPLVDALRAVQGEDSMMANFVNVVGLTGLIASFFSIIYGYSRLVFALSRAGYLPEFMSRTSSRKIPIWALIVPGIFGFFASLTGEGDMMIMMAVFGATISYAMQAYSAIRLRKTRPDIKRPYLAPGGDITAWITIVLSLIALTSCFVYDQRAAIAMVVMYAIGMGYFFMFKHKEVSKRTAEEEFALIEQGEAELD